MSTPIVSRSPLILTAALLAACQAGGPDTPATPRAEAADSRAAIVCPDNLPAVDLDQAPEYDSWLIMQGGGFGQVMREWHNGCIQQLSFPALAVDNPHADEPESDYKPVHSPDGESIAFFRRHQSVAVAAELLILVGDNVHGDWRTTINVMNALDGSGLRALTSIDNPPAFNPMWTRKQFPNQAGGQGYRISFTRGGQVWWTDLDAQPGDERLLTDAAGGGHFGYSSLKDGRLLVRIDESLQLALITPDETDPTQTQVAPLRYLDGAEPMPVLHKITISPDETKIAYMKVEGTQDPYGVQAFGQAQIAYADLDVNAHTISNEVVVSDPLYNNLNIEWYPSWSRTNRQLIWVCSGNCPYWQTTVPVHYYTDNSQVVEYDLDSGQIRRISRDLEQNYRYPNIWGTVK